MIFAAIADWVDSSSYPVTFMCDQLGVSTSGYYKWRSRTPSARESQDAALTRLINHFFASLRGGPGPDRALLHRDDITCIKTWHGWAHVATVIDLHSRALVGWAVDDHMWAVDDHMRTSLITDAPNMAITHHRPPKGAIFHSDRGTQGHLCLCAQISPGLNRVPGDAADLRPVG